MFFRMFVVLGLLAASAGSDASASDLPQAALDEVRSGGIDVCRDERWPRWRFDESKDGRARIAALKALAVDAREKLAIEDAICALECARLLALQNILDAVAAAPRRAAWTASLARAETAHLNWRARAATIDGASLSSMLKRRGLWRLARSRSFERTVQDPVGAGIGGCLIAGEQIPAVHAVVSYLVEALDRGRYPTEAADGPGAATAILGLSETDRGIRYVSRNWKRLSDGLAPAGVLPLWRVFSSIDPDPPSSAEAVAQRFEDEWARIGEMFDALPPPSSVGEELYRRTRPEQYGRLSLLSASTRFATDPKRGDTLATIWKRISAADVANTARIKVLLQTRDWFDDDRDGDGAEANGWLIVQHSDLEPAFQREILDRMEPLLATGRVRRRNYAYLWDRVAVAEGRPQRYGTQYTCKDRKWVLSATENPKRLDARRKSMGLEPAQTTLDGVCG